MFRKLNRSFAVVGVGLLAASLSLAGGESIKTKKRKTRADAKVEIKGVPVGPSEELIGQVKTAVERSAAVQKELGGTNYRLISLEYLQDNLKTTEVFSPQRFRIIFYDYTNDRTLLADGSLNVPEDVLLTEDAAKPLPSAEELEAAQNLVARDERFAAAIKGQRARTFEAMPPITVTDSGERLINIGVESLDSGVPNEVVSISFKRSEVVRYDSAAPPTSKADAAACGIPSSGQGSTPRGLAGQAAVTITRGGTTLWEYTVIRPSASSGGQASGIELLNVKYRGKMVLKQAHAPVLNVQYVNNACGPFLDWQYNEGFFQAPDTGAQTLAPGIRLLAEGQIATTALETGNDTGNFQGVAIYRQNNETVMVSEMNAGWYRYIMEWRLADDGTIKPRYGYGATNNSCVCAIHTHHTYWRFDFEIVTPNNKLFRIERGRRFMQPILNEQASLRNYATNRSFVVQNGSGDEAYLFAPNLTDGVTDTYGRGDFWFFRYNAGQLGTTSGSAININTYLNNESIDNQDLVLWYGAHFIHADGANLLDPDRSGLTLSGAHVVGPEIRPIRW